MVGGGTDGLDITFAPKVPHSNCHSNPSFPKLLSLNLHNNRLFQLDGLSDITQMVPTVRNLNLSYNEVRGGQIGEWLRVVGGVYESADGGQAQEPVGEGRRLCVQGLGCPSFPGTMFLIPSPHFSASLHLGVGEDQRTEARRAMAGRESLV